MSASTLTPFEIPHGPTRPVRPGRRPGRAPDVPRR